MCRIDGCLGNDGEVARECKEGFWKALGRNGEDVCGVDATRRGTWRNVEDKGIEEVGSGLVELVLGETICLMDDDVKGEVEDGETA